MPERGFHSGANYEAQEFEMKFLIDSMLGKLAKWLRVLGYDSHYQSRYDPATIGKLVQQGRRLISRRKETLELFKDTLLIHSNNVGEQLLEVKENITIEPDSLNWFSRCLICNSLLQEVEEEDVRENVPEYIFFQNLKKIRFCPECKRYYWPGSHRARMIRQLEKWGFKY